MENKIVISLNNNFLYNLSVNKYVKNYPNLNNKELEIFENFIRKCYKKLNYRNKESWWYKSSNGKKIETKTGNFFENNNIWHLHLDENLIEVVNGKEIIYEIYPGITANYIICYSKEVFNEINKITILIFAEHPIGVIWDDVKNNIDVNFNIIKDF